MEPYNIAVLGGDARQTWAADTLEVLGHRVLRFGVPQKPTGELPPKNASTLSEALADADVVLGPVPFTKCDGLLTYGAAPPIPIPDLLAELRPGQRLIAGNFPPEVLDHCRVMEVTTYALLDREDFATLNAIPTAEATIAQAIVRSTGNLQQSECVVLGFGRCGRALARKLKGLDANVTVAVRHWHSACAALTAGFQTVDMKMLPLLLPRAQFVFNTIPPAPDTPPALGEALLKLLSKEALVLDIASAPGGVDYDAARELELRAALLPSLPGKYSPRAAGEAIAQVTQVILQEEENANAQSD